MRLFVKFEERKPDPEMLAQKSKPIIKLGTLAWLLIFIGLAVFYPSLADAGLQWWLHTALVGVGLGLIGLYIIRND